MESPPEPTGFPWGAAVLLVGVVLVAVFAVQNTESVHVEFLWFEGRFPLAIVILVTAVAAVLLAELAGLVYRRRRRRLISDRAELKRLRDESS